MVYKVIFKGSNKIEKEKLSLTFKELSSDSIIKLPADYLNKLKKINNQKIIHFQNIDAVLRFGIDSSLPNYTFYHVILFSFKERKQGILVGNLKKEGDVLIGIWPFRPDLNQESEKDLINTYEDLVNNPKIFQEICIIN
ncbi:MAG: hypothetical protein KGD57_02035 [Candidatus Lokiarchaeota archaeon]|nr:hypothetical protein [Candidatus Lokiarchaeota archaeon]